MADMAITANNVFKTFNAGRSNEVKAVCDVSLQIQKNNCVILKGPSGSGKTTLLTILSCLARPSSGELNCLGKTVSHWPEKFLTSFRQKHIGIIFQNFNLVDKLSVYWNIAAPLVPLNHSAPEIRNKVVQAAEKVQISHRLHFNVNTLSGGEMQRVAIARSLVSNPDILIADEPTAHLDSGLATDLLELFNILKKQGKTLVIATHDPLVEQLVRVDHVFNMLDGTLSNGTQV